MKRIRVICSDPYATDCSSDDEESVEEKNPTNAKLFVQEISASIPPIPTISTIHLDSLAMLISDAGTFSVQTRSEKLSMAQKCHPDITNSSSRKDGPAKDNPTCINEAIDVTVAENHGRVGEAKHPGLQLTPSGKWDVRIRHPIKKIQICLGTYDTIKEATNVYNNKRLEYATLRRLPVKSKKNISALLQSKKIVCPRVDTVKVPDVSSAAVMDCQGLSGKKYKGVRQRKSGRWTSEIRYPFSRVRLFLGTFDTAEEAADAYNGKRLEFDLMISLAKKQKQEGNAQAHKKKKLKAKSKSKKGGFIPEEAGKGYDEQGHLFEPMVLPQPDNQQPKVDSVCEVIQSGLNCASPSFTFDAENSAVTVVSSQDSEGSNTNNDKEMPSFSLAAEEFGFGVINSYGQFIGEYSRLDDELWLSEPGDGDDCDADCTIDGTEDLAWDHKPSSSLLK